MKGKEAPPGLDELLAHAEPGGVEEDAGRPPKKGKGKNQALRSLGAAAALLAILLPSWVFFGTGSEESQTAPLALLEAEKPGTPEAKPEPPEDLGGIGSSLRREIPISVLGSEKARSPKRARERGSAPLKGNRRAGSGRGLNLKDSPDKGPAGKIGPVRNRSKRSEKGVSPPPESVKVKPPKPFLFPAPGSEPQIHFSDQDLIEPEELEKILSTGDPPGN